MGGDGGSIARRVDIVVRKKREGKLDGDVLSLNRYRNCSISQTPLHPPVVACDLGNLYNKDALIQYLLGRHKSHNFSHIRSLKDVIPCRLYFSNQSEKPKDEHDNFVCPVTNTPGTGKYRFLVMRHCGCVISERATKEVPSKNCLACQKPIPNEDYDNGEWAILLYPPTPEDLDEMRVKMEAHRARLKAKKKDAKAVERKEEAASAAAAVTDATASSTQDAEAPKADAANPAREHKEESTSSAPKKRKEEKSASDSGKMKSSKKSEAVDAASSSRPTLAPERVSLSDPASVARLAASKVDARTKDNKMLSALFRKPSDKIEQFFQSGISTKPFSSMARL